MEVVGSLATILGLVCNFKSERRVRTDDEYSVFMEWLDAKRHMSVIDDINSNHQLSLSIKSLMKREHEEVMLQLQSINESLSLLSSKVFGLKDIARSIEPNIVLSEQVVSIMKQFYASEGSFFVEAKSASGTAYIMDGKGGSLIITEPRFVDDDLEQLINLGLLRLDYNKSGDRLFRLTRALQKYVAQLNDKPAPTPNNEG
ncbi:hypothetical protein J8M20_23125 [Pseudoalteromonas luteoviolacea]|uniref:hypothetical protein n=1 Tax=Pseudoalteromonas luteoviolacea TaxID=43657 RepID=UPI001B3653D3|nr:hypothetical protein [Pseudoalteromonas luteoviolacea]MBQ4814279.1 hypothetical protein [Pseudoalteromonas luteoviolacea]